LRASLKINESKQTVLKPFLQKAAELIGNANDAGAGERWRGELDLRFAKAANRTILCSRRHFGPLRVQKPLYPEGPEICHVVVIHPPGGLADGDDLSIRLTLEQGAHSVITTPGATKWYKAKEGSTLRVTILLRSGAILEWLPNENIYFASASARTTLRIEPADGAIALGWDINMLGRIASGESWETGVLRAVTEFVRDNGSPIWSERTLLQAGSDLVHAHQGLGGYPIFGTLWCVGAKSPPNIIETLAAELPFTSELRAGISLLPDNVILVRAVGRQIEPVRSLMIDCWSRIRPMVIGRDAQALRLWST
jgi:urease accessory protein